MSPDAFLPAGFPAPDREAVLRLRQNIVEGTRTPFPPTDAELALVMAADDAGLDHTAIDAAGFWLNPHEERAAVLRVLAGWLAAQ